MPVQRSILASGSLQLSPPQPAEVGNKLLGRLKKHLASKGHTLGNGHADSLIQGLIDCGIVSLWIQQEAGLDDWENRMEQVDALLVSDVEYEVSTFEKKGLGNK